MTIYACRKNNNDIIAACAFILFFVFWCQLRQCKQTRQRKRRFEENYLMSPIMTDLELKNRGNKLFSVRKYDEAIKCYTDAIVSILWVSFIKFFWLREFHTTLFLLNFTWKSLEVTASEPC